MSTTAVAQDKLLEALARLDHRPDGLRDLATHCLKAGHFANERGQKDTATVWAAVLELVIGVAEDRLDPSEIGGVV